MIRTIFTISALVFCISSHADELKWAVQKYNNQENAVRIAYAREGFNEFIEAVESIPEGTWIKEIGLWGRIVESESKNIQQELLFYLKEKHPKELEAALMSISAGNGSSMNNPKVAALIQPFSAAILSTSYVAQLNKVLSKHCHEITEVWFEKFFIIERRNAPEFDASFVGLRTKRCT